jgi:hypothetical protein
VSDESLEKIHSLPTRCTAAFSGRGHRNQRKLT